MKKITILFYTLCVAGLLNAQETPLNNAPVPEAEVPQVVRTSQKANFPDGYVSSWFIDRGLTAGDDAPVRYISQFGDSFSTNTHFATYLPNGMLFYDAKFLEAAIIPSDIMLQVRKAYDDYEVVHAKLFTLYEPKRQIYQVKLRNQAYIQMAYYTIDGRPIPKKELPEALLVFKY
ncbi:hypothetical protein [uncultured Altibacter sp.]|uniref:hypothetical protein n=1 Tax=uncultured Altibacter sp. TaxID=2506933 RepID=UPI0030DD0203|tara:strand:+ start:247 stop:771 length:525 start_codon:yes stop_codon:yes gene_type:complete